MIYRGNYTHYTALNLFPSQTTNIGIYEGVMAPYTETSATKIVLTYTDICIVRTVNIIKPIPIHHLHACVEKL